MLHRHGAGFLAVTRGGGEIKGLRAGTVAESPPPHASLSSECAPDREKRGGASPPRIQAALGSLRTGFWPLGYGARPTPKRLSAGRSYSQDLW
jgi:hypothetical protein